MNKPALLQEVIEKLSYFTHLYGINSLFIAGGFCRGLFLDQLDTVEDLDVASAYDEQAQFLGGLFATEVAKTPPVNYKSGTLMVEYESNNGKLRVEFQGRSPNSYMFNAEVNDWFRAHVTEDVPLMHNLYGRDFTINSLVYSLSNNQLYDPTGRAMGDFKKEKITSLLPPEILVKNNPICILRAIRFSLMYDYRIDGALKNEMKKNMELLKKNVAQDRILHEIVKILKIDSKKRLETLEEFGLNGFLLHPELKKYLKVSEKSNA